MTGEALLDDSISATRFAPDASDGDLPGRVRAVVIGGGMAGSSAAYHLAGLGVSDVLVLERTRIASGTSWHAAGLLARVRGSHPMTELAGYGVDTYARLEAETGVPIGYHRSGSLTLARTPGRMDEIAYTAAMARHHEVEANIIAPRGRRRAVAARLDRGAPGRAPPAGRRLGEPGLGGARIRQGRARPRRDHPRRRPRRSHPHLRRCRGRGADRTRDRGVRDRGGMLRPVDARPRCLRAARRSRCMRPSTCT